MIKEISLNKITVKDIRNLLVPTPVTASPDDSIEDLLKKLSEDLRIRNVYVIDDKSKLVGAVRMNMTLEYLFPLAALIEKGTDFREGWVPNLSISATVADIMNPRPRFVTENQTLSEIAMMLLREKVTELPVVDDNGTLIGQVNTTEIIVAHLNMKYQDLT